MPAVEKPQHSLVGKLQSPAAKAALTSLWAIVRVLLVLMALLTIYEFLPVPDTTSVWAVFGSLTLLLLIWLVVVLRQVLKLRKSNQPIIEVSSSLVLTLILLVISFSLTYLMIATAYPHAFSEPINKPAALYFSMTVTSTVGFGDIVPVSDLARHVVTFQMFLNLLWLGFVLNAITTVAKARKYQLVSGAASTTADASHDN